MWKKRIIERECEWCGVEGGHFDTIKYIDVIFYSMKNVKERDGYISYGAIGACVGGGGVVDLAISSLNGTLKKGQAIVTKEEIDAEIIKAAEEIESDPERHKFTPEPYPEYF